jgi:hypothetical protein
LGAGAWSWQAKPFYRDPEPIKKNGAGAFKHYFVGASKNPLRTTPKSRCQAFLETEPEPVKEIYKKGSMKPVYVFLEKQEPVLTLVLRIIFI